jgi:hypothetical protein
LTVAAKITDPADFEEPVFSPSEILAWATSETGGGLPDVSARPFATWLDFTWNDFGDESEIQTNEDVLKGALEHWTGGRS